MYKHCVALAAFALAGISHAATTTVYSDDFDGNRTGYATSITGANYLDFPGVYYSNDSQVPPGFGGHFLWNATAKDSQTNEAKRIGFQWSDLPAHTSITISFRLALIDAWKNGTYGGLTAVDEFNVAVDGTTRQQIACRLLSNNGTQCDTGGSAMNPVIDHFFDLHDKNPDTPDPLADLARDVVLTIAHSNASLAIEMFASGIDFAGPQSPWALDNFSVVAELANDGVATVPSAPTLLLVGAGVVPLVVRRRRPARG